MLLAATSKYRATCNFPLHISEDKYFRAFVYDAQPFYKPICYRTVVNTLDGLSQKSTEDFILEIRKTDSRYSIGLDLWSGRDKKEYMGCIITFMKHWQLVSFLLFFSPLLDSPTAANVLKHVRNEFDRLGLRFNPFSICTDNYAVMKKSKIFWGPTRTNRYWRCEPRRIWRRWFFDYFTDWKRRSIGGRFSRSYRHPSSWTDLCHPQGISCVPNAFKSCCLYRLYRRCVLQPQ